jgi:hypothetical protein
MNPKVELIKINKIPISIGVDKYVFPIKNSIVHHNQDSLLGSTIVSDPGYSVLGFRRDPKALSNHNLAFELAELAWKIQEFDLIYENTS